MDGLLHPRSTFAAIQSSAVEAHPWLKPCASQLQCSPPAWHWGDSQGPASLPRSPHQNCFHQPQVTSAPACGSFFICFKFLFTARISRSRKPCLLGGWIASCSVEYLGCFFQVLSKKDQSEIPQTASTTYLLIWHLKPIQHHSTAAQQPTARTMATSETKFQDATHWLLSQLSMVLLECLSSPNKRENTSHLQYAALWFLTAVHDWCIFLSTYNIYIKYINYIHIYYIHIHM